jgi:hypothetical protein
LWSRQQLRFWQVVSLIVRQIVRWLAAALVLQQVPLSVRLRAVARAPLLPVLQLVLLVERLSARQQRRRTASHMTVMATHTASFAPKASLDNIIPVRIC